jgi:cytochrome P450
MSTKKHLYQYVPFGGGAHMCIGLHFAEMQVKAILHHVVQRYRWSVADDYVMRWILRHCQCRGWLAG